MGVFLKFKREERGQGLVEFALVLPILLALVLGIIEFGWALNGKITLNSAVREGARAAAVYKYTDLADLNGVAQAAVISNSSASGLSDQSTKTTVHLNAAYLVDKIEVEASANFNPIIGLYIRETIEMKSKAIMKKE